MSRLAIKQILKVPKYVNEMVIIRSQDQLTPLDEKCQSKFGSPFEMNLSGWSRSELKPNIRELIEGPLIGSESETGSSRFGPVNKTQRLDLKRARRRAKLFTHITAMTGGLFSNWKQVSKSVGVYSEFLQNRMDYEIDAPVRFPVGNEFVPNNELQRKALERFKAQCVESKEVRLESNKGPGFSRLTKADKRLKCMIDETKVISKSRFVQMNSLLEKYPIV
eukprot:g724.t1